MIKWLIHLLINVSVHVPVAQTQCFTAVELVLFGEERGGGWTDKLTSSPPHLFAFPAGLCASLCSGTSYERSPKMRGRKGVGLSPQKPLRIGRLEGGEFYIWTPTRYTVTTRMGSWGRLNRGLLLTSLPPYRLVKLAHTYGKHHPSFKTTFKTLYPSCFHID